VNGPMTGVEVFNGIKSSGSTDLVPPFSVFLYLGLSPVGAGMIFLYMSMYAFASLTRAYGFETKKGNYYNENWIRGKLSNIGNRGR
jgi:hypothetical protein